MSEPEIIHHCGECFTGNVCPVCMEYVPNPEPLELRPPRPVDNDQTEEAHVTH